MNLTDSRPARLATLSILYFAQGMPWGFISVGYGVMMTDLGLDAAAIGAAVGLAYRPWSFKVLWGPMLDAVPALTIGRRRPFILFAELMMALSLLGLLVVDPRTQLGLVGAVLFLHNTFAAMQDVAVDALAVDVLPDDEKGTANALMWAGKSLGVVAGGGGGTLVAKALGWDALFLGMAGLLAAVMLLPLLLPERRPEPGDQPPSAALLKLAVFLLPFIAVAGAMFGMGVLEERLAGHPLALLVPVLQPVVAVAGALLMWPVVDRPGFDRLAASFRTPTPWWAVLAGILTPAGYAMVGPASSKLLRGDLGLSEERIALISGVIDPAAGVLGALAGGALADRLGVRRSMAMCMGGIGAFLLVWSMTSASWGVFGWLVVWTALLQALINAYNAGSLGMYMSVSNPRVGATHFAIYMAATNLTYAWTAPLGGLIADRYGFAILFAVAAGVQVVAIPLLLPIDAKRAQEHFQRV